MAFRNAWSIVNLFGLTMNIVEALLKSQSHLPKKLFYLLKWKSFRYDENVLFFILKALFVFKIFKFLPWLFGHLEKTTWLERILISKIMASQSG